MDNDEKFSLRDKLAIEILNGMISAETDGRRVVTKLIFPDGYDKTRHDKEIETSIRIAYRVADMMRKVRLTTFE